MFLLLDYFVRKKLQKSARINISISLKYDQYYLVYQSYYMEYTIRFQARDAQIAISS